MASTDPLHVPVLIIGGGIVGLSASLFLHDHNIHSMLIERHVGTSIHPRARSVNSRTMEIYRGIGLADAFREAGKSLSPSNGLFQGATVKEIIDPKPRVLGARRPFPLENFFSGIGPEIGAWGTLDMTEPVLLQAAKDRGVDARFHTECLGVEQDEERIIATLKKRSDNTTYTVTADYLIAADGANSPIRESLGIKRSGRGSYGNLLNILFSTTPSLESYVQGREFSICQIERPKTKGIFTSINNKERWVFHLLFHPEKGEKQEDFSAERCAEIISSSLGMPEYKIDIKSILPWQSAVRVAEKINKGRIFIAGDAAHQMPPFAGQGANSGIADVHNLAWKLAAVIKKQAAPKLLDTYEMERLPVDNYAAQASGDAADEDGLMMIKRDFKTFYRLARRMHIMAGFGYEYDSPSIIQESTWPLGGASWRPWTAPSLFLSLDGRPGTRAPHVWFEKRSGETTTQISSLDLLGAHFVLLAGSDGARWLHAAGEASETFKSLDIKAYALGSATTTAPADEILDPERKWETAAGISSTGALLVRPDGFVAWRERRMPANVEKRLEEVLRQLLFT